MKGNKKLFTIFIVEIIIVGLITLGIVSYYNKNFGGKIASINEFNELLTSNNYKVEDVSKNYINSSIKNYYLATKDGENLGVHYIKANDKKSATNVFNSLVKQFKSTKSGFSSTVSVSLFNYEYYSLENNSNYFMIARKDDTVLATTGLSKYKSEFNNILKDLKFDYPTSAFYIIGSVVLIVYVLFAIVTWKIFEKAGIKGWKSLIPIYNCYCLSKIAFNKGWYFIFMLITPINILFIPVTCYKLSKAFGKSNLFAVISIFFPYITNQIIAFDDSKYIN